VSLEHVDGDTPPAPTRALEKVSMVSTN